MSNLSNIYDAIDAISVTYETKTPTVYKPSELKVAFETADLPARILMPLDVGVSGGMSAFLDAANNAELQWTVTDMLLISPVGQSTRSANSASVIAYVDAYVAEMLQNRNIVAGCDVRSFEFDAAVREYPVGSERFYYSVTFSITIREIA